MRQEEFVISHDSCDIPGINEVHRKLCETFAWLPAGFANLSLRCIIWYLTEWYSADQLMEVLQQYITKERGADKRKFNVVASLDLMRQRSVLIEPPEDCGEPHANEGISFHWKYLTMPDAESQSRQIIVTMTIH